MKKSDENKNDRENRFRRLVERQTTDENLQNKKLKDHRKIVFKDKKNEYNK